MLALHSFYLFCVSSVSRRHLLTIFTYIHALAWSQLWNFIVSQPSKLSHIFTRYFLDLDKIENLIDKSCSSYQIFYRKLHFLENLVDSWGQKLALQTEYAQV